MNCRNTYQLDWHYPWSLTTAKPACFYSMTICRKKYVRSKINARSHAWIVDISGSSESEESKEARSKERWRSRPPWVSTKMSLILFVLHTQSGVGGSFMEPRTGGAMFKTERRREPDRSAACTHEYQMPGRGAIRARSLDLEDYGCWTWASRWGCSWRCTLPCGIEVKRTTAASRMPNVDRLETQPRNGSDLTKTRSNGHGRSYILHLKSYILPVGWKARMRRRTDPTANTER